MSTRLLGATFAKDDYGVVSFTIPFACDSMEEASAGSLSSGLSLPENPSKRTGREWEGGQGKWVVQAVFEGAVGDLNEDRYFWEFDSSFKHADIRGHPRLQELIRKYGGQIQDDGTINWPLTLPTKNSNAFGAAKNQSNKNPMFGADSYLELGAVFRGTRIRRSVSSDLLDRIGTIRKSLPQGLPTPPNRDWLVFPPRAYERGNVIQEVDEWLLGPIGGWPEVQELVVL